MIIIKRSFNVEMKENAYKRQVIKY